MSKCSNSKGTGLSLFYAARPLILVTIFQDELEILSTKPHVSRKTLYCHLRDGVDSATEANTTEELVTNHTRSTSFGFNFVILWKCKNCSNVIHLLLAR